MAHRADPGPFDLVPAPAAPDYAGACLSTLLPAIGWAIGARDEGFGNRYDVGARSVLGIAERRRIALLLVDGLGARQFAQRAGHARFLAGRPRIAIDAAFPTTTAVSLTSLGTGLPPGQTGIVGYQVRDPASGRMVSMVNWQGADPRQWQPRASILGELNDEGVAGIAVLPSKFIGSGLTTAAFRGAHTRGADSPTQLLDVASEALREPGPGFVYIYWGELDRVGHSAGWRSHAWGEQLAEIDAFAAALAARCPEHAAIYLTSDHGMVDVAAGPTWDVAAVPSLAQGVAAVGGEPRCLQLYVTDPAADVAQRWRSELGHAAWVMTKHEAIAAGYFGEADSRARDVIGDVVVAMTGQATVVDSRVHSANYRNLAGQHGSLTAAERKVPLIRLG